MGDGTSIGKVRGTGSAHSGSHHWLLQRFTAIANLLLAGWLIASFALLPGFSFATVHDWIVGPLPGIAIALLIVSTFWHAKLGLQVLIEDYVHESANKFACITALNLASFGGAGFGLLCVIRLALGGA
jgi:succinate dehydrogenase / fumarate reductase membrane anchor subunit